jgi:hypothetical protein
MGKTIIISKRQLTEIAGVDPSYLDDIDDDTNEFRASTEVILNPDLSNKKTAKPITTDDIAMNMAKNPSWSNHGNTRPIPINCSKKKSKLVEANDAGENRTWYIPDNIYKTIQTNVSNYKGDKNASGWDRANNLLKNRDVGYDEMRRLKNFFDHSTAKDAEYYDLFGGKDTANWVNNSLKSFVATTSSNKKNMKTLGVIGSEEHKQAGNGQAHTPSSPTTTFTGKIDTL